MTTIRGRRAGGGMTGVFVGLCVLAAAALGWWLAVGNEAEAGLVDESRVVEVVRRDLIDGVNASGRVEPLARVAVMSRASGIIEQLFVEEGDTVTEGQVLAQLDREQIEAQLAEQKADQASARARVAAAEARLAEAEVRLTDPDLDFRKREAARLAQLYESGDVTLVERDEAARAFSEVEFRIAQVEASLPVLRAAIAEARANLESADAAVERVETSLRESTVRSPIDGIVLVRDREVGDGVSSILTAGGNATPLMTLGDLSQMFVEARVDEVDLGRIHVGMPTLTTVDAHRGRSLEGEILRIAPAGSVDGNGIVTFVVRVSVVDPEGLLKPDMTADVKMVVARRDGALCLPQRALRRSEDGVWTAQRVVAGGTERVEVELGLSDGLLTQVVSGLEESDRVLLPESGATGRR